MKAAALAVIQQLENGGRYYQEPKEIQGADSRPAPRQSGFDRIAFSEARFDPATSRQKAWSVVGQGSL